jgi:hypothetical protein
MDAHHILTANEKHVIEARVLARERAKHPTSAIEVTVENETDARGKPIIRIKRVDVVDMIAPPPPPPEQP